MSAIELRGLVKRYDTRAVVDDLSLSVQVGECLVLLGPNGAGKTTTVEICEGFRRPTAGLVRVLDSDPAAADRRWRARVGVVAQTTGVALHLSVAETLSHYAAYHAQPRPTDELLDAVGLGAQRGVRVAKLSGGQRRRLDLALGVQGRPDLLFLDEPTTGLDPQARRQFRLLIDQLRGEGTTIVLTTHDLDEAARLADRVAVIAAGRLLDLAVPERIGAVHRAGVTVRWTHAGATREVVTASPTAVVRDLVTTHHDEIADLAIVRPSLEDAYLALLADVERAA